MNKDVITQILPVRVDLFVARRSEFLARLTARAWRELHPGDFGARGISARHHSRNIGAPLEATGFLNWVSKDVTLRWKRDAITGTASYYDSSRGYGIGREWGKVKRVVSRHLGTPCRLAEGTNGESTPQ